MDYNHGMVLTAILPILSSIEAVGQKPPAQRRAGGFFVLLPVFIFVTQTTLDHRNYHVVEASVILLRNLVDLIHKVLLDINGFVDCFFLAFCWFEFEFHTISPLRIV